MTALKPCPACGAEFPRHWQVGGGSKACPNNSCNVIGPMKDDDGAKWNAMARPSDIVAARIEGLREGLEEVSLLRNGEYDDVRQVVHELQRRIAELEATAPEVSETRAKAEAFDDFLGQLARVDPDSMAPSLKAVPAYCRHWMLTCLAEAKRKGAGR